MDREKIRIYFAAHSFVYLSQRGVKIAGVLGINTPTLYDTIVDSPVWSEALTFWGHPNPEQKPKGYRGYKRKKKQKAKEVKSGPNPPNPPKSLTKQWLYAAQGGMCCGCRIQFPLRNMTLDHIKPKSKSGSNRLSNQQLLCGQCNSLKSDGTQEELIELLNVQGVLRS